MNGWIILVLKERNVNWETGDCGNKERVDTV
jgi:hypothetical protein